MPLSSFTISLSLARLCRWLTKITLLTPADVMASTCFCTRAAVVATSVVVTTTGAGEEIVGRSGVVAETMPNRLPVTMSETIAALPTTRPLAIAPVTTTPEVSTSPDHAASGAKSRLPLMKGWSGWEPFENPST